MEKGAHIDVKVLAGRADNESPIRRIEKVCWGEAITLIGAENRIRPEVTTGQMLKEHLRMNYSQLLQP